MLINVPAGADANGTAHGRRIGYPNWDVNDPKVLETAQYFDTVNCAARIKVPSLVAMGFIDTVTPPVGIWAAYNQIQGPKQAAPMLDSPHNHLATPEQSMPWTRASDGLAQRAGRRPPAHRARPTCRCRAPTRIRMTAHQQLLAKRKAGQIDVYFEGDSITRRWGTSDEQYKDLLANWNANFKGWNAANFGWGGDKTQNMLWRLQNGELDGVESQRSWCSWPAPTTSAMRRRSGDAGRTCRRRGARRGGRGQRNAQARTPGDADHHRHHAARRQSRASCPSSTPPICRLRSLADGKSVRYININEQLAFPDGQLREGMSPDGLHFTAQAYQDWANALKPMLTEILGPPAAVDHAPPPTGDPSAAPRQPNP